MGGELMQWWHVLIAVGVFLTVLALDIVWLRWLFKRKPSPQPKFSLVPNRDWEEKSRKVQEVFKQAMPLGHLVKVWHPTVKGLFIACMCDPFGKIVGMQAQPPSDLSFKDGCRLNHVEYQELQRLVTNTLRKEGKLRHG